MTRRLISSGSVFEAKIGYSRAVIDGDFAFVAGTTGFDYKAGTLPEDVVAQCENTFRNIDAALEQAGFAMADVVRATYYLPERADFEKCWPVMQKYFGEVRPAATMLVAGLADPRMKIEIEVTAKKRG